ncbi:MAG: arylsulfatase [Armatimonadetes bacterium]|nr:arylsulfatase [Armatimonadota bacterium]
MPRPNLVFVLTDDQGYGDLGCHGNPILRTPELDAFHEVSARLTNFHVGPICAPTRAGLLTGHYPNSTGVWHTIGGRSVLRHDEWTLPQALGEAGYRTGIFGKWHLGDAYPYRPQDRGFQVSLVHGGGGISQTPDYWGNDYFDDTYAANGHPRACQGYCTDVFFDEALRFMAAHREQPFFCYLATNAPHSPYNVEPAFREPYDGRVPEARARFYGMIANLDANFGRLRRALAEWGLEENTILVFMTDNGSSGGARLDGQGFVTEGYNAGLRGMKGSPYEGGHRVPCFVRWPAGGLRHGRDHAVLAANVDFMPTMLELCGVDPPAGRSFHGRSLAADLRGEPGAARTLVTDMQWVSQPVKWRRCAVMTERWRLINGSELYDLMADPGQRHDVAAAEPAVVAELQAEYEGWWELVSARFGEPIPFVLGDQETHLTAHDWRVEVPDCPWSQGEIRKGKQSNGCWEVEVSRPGRYRFELRRWPSEAARPITAGIEGDDGEWRRDAIAEADWHHYTGGAALAITRAELKLGEVAASTAVAEGEQVAVLTVELPAGPGQLWTWLSGPEVSLGAYYVSVRREG